MIGQSSFTEAGLDLSKAIRVAAGSAFDPPGAVCAGAISCSPVPVRGPCFALKPGSTTVISRQCQLLCGFGALKRDRTLLCLVGLENPVPAGTDSPLAKRGGHAQLEFPGNQGAADSLAGRGGTSGLARGVLPPGGPLHLARLQALDPLERSRLGELADAAFRRLVQELEETLNTRYFPRDKSNG